MTFYERFEGLCKARGLGPSGQRLEKLMKEKVNSFSRTTPNKWKTGESRPTGEIITAIADILNVSTDYLLCRTEDPTDHTQTEPELTAKERELLKMFRTLNPQQQDTILTMIEPLYEQAKKVPVESA